MKYCITHLCVALTLILTCVPSVSFAVIGSDGGTGVSDPKSSNFQLVPCDGVAKVGKQGSVDCDFNTLVLGIQRVIDFAVWLGIILSTFMFAYAGFKILTAGGDTEARKLGKKVLTDSAVGLALVLGAWLIVYTIVNSLIDPKFKDSTFLQQK